MRVREIKFGDDELPEEITITIAARELYMLGVVVGPTTDLERDQIHPGWGGIGADYYDLASQVANAYFEAGLQDRELRKQL